MGKGDKQAMANYNGQQVKQLTRLIEVTRTDLPKVSPCLSLEKITCRHDVRSAVSDSQAMACHAGSSYRSCCACIVT
jgi:hypothetical protein